VRKKLIALTAMSLLSTTAWAAEDNILRWTLPTTYENGEPLPPAEILKYMVNVTWQGEAQQVLEAPGGTNTTFTHRVNTRGTWCYTLQTVSVDNMVSVVSNEACKTVTHGNPNPPRDLTVQ